MYDVKEDGRIVEQYNIEMNIDYTFHFNGIILVRDKDYNIFQHHTKHTYIRYIDLIHILGSYNKVPSNDKLVNFASKSLKRGNTNEKQTIKCKRACN